MAALKKYLSNVVIISQSLCYKILDNISMSNPYPQSCLQNVLSNVNNNDRLTLIVPEHLLLLHINPLLYAYFQCWDQGNYTNNNENNLMSTTNIH